MARHPTSRRLVIALRAGCLIAVVLVAVFVWPLMKGEPWYPLPGGGEVRLERVAYGDDLVIVAPGASLPEVRHWLGPKWSHLLGPYPMSIEIGLSEERFAVVFITRGRAGSALPADTRCEIDLPGEQTQQTTLISSAGDGERMWEFATFPIAPLAERTLNIRLNVEGKTLRFTVRNPAFVRHPPRWKAEALPQTHTVEGVEITLERVVGEWTENWFFGSTWRARAEFAVRIDGQERGRWVDVWPTFCDPLGNESSYSALFSEPVWKVRCRMMRTDRYPYADAEVAWLGRVALPGPGEARVIALTPATRNTRLNLLALLGPGRYDAVEGQITALPAPADGTVVRPIRSYYQAGVRQHMEINTTGLELLSIATTDVSNGQEGGPPYIFMRDDAGRRLPLRRTHSDGRPELRATPFPPGTREVEVGLVEVHQMSTEFSIAAPQPPSGKANGTRAP